jgi:hypothetical protein
LRGAGSRQGRQRSPLPPAEYRVAGTSALFGCGARRSVAGVWFGWHHTILLSRVPERDSLDLAPGRFQRAGVQGKPPETARVVRLVGPGWELAMYRAEE